MGPTSFPARRGLLTLRRARRDLVAGGVLVLSVLLLLADGSRLAARAALTHAPGGDGLATGVLLNLALVLIGWRQYRQLRRAIVAEEHARARADARAQVDELTGFLTRAAFLHAAAPRAGSASAMLVVDLDDFKTVNDLHGHGIGDAVLCAAAAAIRAALPADAVAGRLAGDALLVAVPFDAGRPGTADRLATDLLAVLARPVAVRGVVAHLGCSIGIARSDRDGEGADALVRHATIAMRAAKRAGRHRHAWFDPAMEQALLARSAVEDGLREGIPAGRFLPFFEQQVDLATGRLLGFEVLARWDHPTRGIVGPEEFIPVAEECGLIGDLSLAVMRRAMAEACDWDATLTLSVNISPMQLRDPWLAQKIVKLLVATGFPPGRLEIEITESALFQNMALAQSIVASLKNQGIRLALDDFGTGYSSLAHLRALPFDRIKIDRSFVAAMAHDPESAAIVQAISGLGDSLNLPITAEGIESAAILDRLAAIGCAEGQGWHFGRPLSIAATRRLLAERGLLPSARAGDGAHPPERRAQG